MTKTKNAAMTSSLALLAALQGCGSASFNSAGQTQRSAPANPSADSKGGASPATADQTANAGGKGETETEPNPIENAEGAVPTPAEPDPIAEIERLNTLCQSATAVTVQKTITFKDPAATCAWGLNGNLSVLNNFMQGRREQREGLDLPADAALCQLSFAFKPHSMRYDDHIILTMNDYVYAASIDPAASMVKKNGFYFYDWAPMAGKAFNAGSTDSYCAGLDAGAPGCVIPESDTVGILDLKPPTATLQQAAVAAGWRFVTDKGLAGAKGVAPNLGFVTLGDNDATDCQHSEFSFDVSVRYIVLP